LPTRLQRRRAERVRLISEPLELARSTSLVDAVAQARDSGWEALLFNDPTLDGTGVAGIGKIIDIVSVIGGAQVESADGEILDRELDDNRVRAVAKLWQRLTETQGGDTTPVLGIGGFAFRPDRDPAPPWGGFPAALIRIPEVILRRRGGRTEALAVRIANGPGAALALVQQKLRDVVTGVSTGFRAPATAHLVTAPSRPPYQWMAAVDAAVAQLNEGRAQKVVLARELIARADGPLHAGSVVRELERRQPSCYVFLMPGADGSALVGASPELLVRREGSRAVSQPMAGTAARGRDTREDGELARSLQGSEKNAREHDVVIDHVRQRYNSAGAKSVQIAPRELLRFPTVQHLASTVTAHFSGTAPPVLELCAALHPTAAVGGAPWPQAANLIDEYEQMERGWYAGAVGWTDASGDGAFAVTLRCGLLWEDGVRLYAGAGVMPDSSPLEELDETDVKFLALLDALRGSLKTPQPTAFGGR
jgi:menaquinone-specific isochorismate synthase